MSLKTTVLFKDTPYVMEVHSRAKISIIDKDTFDQLHPYNFPLLEKSPFVVKDYNKQPVEILDRFQIRVKYV